MGSSPVKAAKNELDFEDEDDFFGGGFGAKKTDKNQKKKNSDNNDPLAFLQRAKEEKQSAA